MSNNGFSRPAIGRGQLREDKRKEGFALMALQWQIQWTNGGERRGGDCLVTRC